MLGELMLGGLIIIILKCSPLINSHPINSHLLFVLLYTGNFYRYIIIKF